MKPSIRSKLEYISDRYQEITALLADPEVQGDSNRFRELSREFAQVEPLSLCYARYLDAEQELQNAEEMLADPMIRLVMQADGVAEADLRDLYSPQSERR